MRAVIVLRYFEEFTEAETAAVLGKSLGTVKSQASRGLTRMRALLDDAQTDTDTDTDTDVRVTTHTPGVRSLS